MKLHYQNVKDIALSLGYEIIDSAFNFYPKISEWLSWYKGKLPEFHDYKVYNGLEHVDKERKSLKMPKIVAEDWATMLFNDKTEIKVGSEKEEDGKTTQNEFQELVDKVLKNNKFDKKFSKFIEQYMALGTGALVEYIDKNGNIKINYIIAPMIFPLRVENDEIIDCIFASVQNGMYYINIHEKQEDDSYKITNKYVKINNKKIEQVAKEDVEEEVIVKHKTFQVFTPCIANNIDIFCPMGISVYANCIDRIKTADLIYDSLSNEFLLGRKRLFISSDVINYKQVTDKDGNTVQIPFFDNNDTEFYSMPSDEDSHMEKIKEINPSLRVVEHTNALQTCLNMISDACGLGNSRYQLVEGNVYQNQHQVISTQSKLYKTLLKHEKIVRDGVIEMCKTILFLSTDNEFEDDITVDFDDSIIEDSAEVQRRALLEYQSGVIDLVEYIVQVYKYTEKQAIDFVEKMKARQPAPEEEPLVE